MERSDLRAAWRRAVAFALGGGAVALLACCVGLVTEEGRPCPCAAGSVCCRALGTCVASGAACPLDEDTGTTAATDGSVAPAEDGGTDASTDGSAAPAKDASTDASTDGSAASDARPPSDAARLEDAARDAASACGAIPAPVIHFTFEDCDDGGVYRDSVSGLVGLRRGEGVHCAQGPLGAALQFDGTDDGGTGGSYVRVMDAPDAADHTCTNACRPSPEQFRQAVTISVVLNVAAGQPFSHILGQWFEKDSFLLLTEGDSTGQRMELSVQPEGDAGPATLSVGFATETWIHWVAIFDGAELRLYEDGKLMLYQPLGATSSLQCTDVPLELGQVGRQGPCGGDLDYAYFKGGMGDLQLFDVALTGEQVAALDCAIHAH